MSSLPELTGDQRAVVERLNDSLAVTSGAGCGKTLVLASRLTELILASPDVNPFDHFMALTFTEKAASEMSARVRRVLLERLKASRGADRQKLAQWVMELPAAHISTIHSFCSWLLRKHAIEAGIDPAFEVLADDLLKDSLQTQAAQEAVLAALQEQHSDAMELLGVQEYARVCEDLVSLLNHPLSWRAEDFADPDATVRRWQGLLRDDALHLAATMKSDPGVSTLLDKLANPPCSASDDKLVVAIRETLGQVRALLALDEKDISRENWPKLAKPKGGIGSIKSWLGTETRKEYREAAGELIERCNEIAQRLEPLGEADLLAAKCLKALTELGRRAKGLYAQQKRRSGRLDFEDLIELTDRLLRENHAIRLQLRQTFRQMLIDECQDTDGRQLLMLWLLVSDPDNPPPPGRLFIVGDVKQSIYRFRGAQAEVFNKLCATFGANRRPLTESFRTHGPGVQFVNHVFAPLMPDYEPMRWKRQEAPPAQSVEILLAEGVSHGAADSAALEAEVIAQRLGQMIGSEQRVWDRQQKQWRPVRPRDVAILFARTTNWLIYERALQQRDIPYYTVAGGGFFKQQEVYDVLNAVEAVENPYNDIALFGLLRGGMIALDDNALVRIALHAQRPYYGSLWAAARSAGLADGPRGQVEFCLDLVARLHAQKDALGPPGVIERLLKETGFTGSLLSQFHGLRRLANVQRLVETARASESAGLHGLGDFARQFRRQVMEEPRFEQAAVLGEDEDVVRLMTIHKAKGLEFPVVVIPEMNCRRGQRSERLLYAGQWGVVYKGGSDDEGKGKEKDKPISSEVAWQREQVQREQEEVRKLYVAITRHEDYLLFVGRGVQEDKSFEKGSEFARLDRALGGRILELAQASGGTIGYGVDGRLQALVKKATPEPVSVKGRAMRLGRKLVEQSADGAALASALAKTGQAAELTLVGPLPASGPARGTFAATALGDFERCPRLFHWRYELRVPTEYRGTAAHSGGAGAVADAPSEQANSEQKRGQACPPYIDAATAGTIFHGCMERLDFAQLGQGERADIARQLLAATVSEFELEVDYGPLVADLSAMLDRLAESELAGQLSGATASLKELPFVLSTPSLDIAGQIDLLLRDAAGAWHIIDYKSDRLFGDDLADHAKRYELQMLLYLDAARRHLASCGQADTLADATLYFLRTGQCWRLADRPGELANRLAVLAESINACRRSGIYPSKRHASCTFCPYGRLCRS